MCTLMEKDALIERVASIQALIARKTTRNGGEHTPDQKRIAELPNYEAVAPTITCLYYN